MAVKIVWQPPLVPEERKKAQRENIIRLEGEAFEGVEVWLRYEKDRLPWHLDAEAPGSTPSRPVAAYRARLVDALRAAGKPVE